MKTNCIIALTVVGLSTLNPQLFTLLAQGTAFSYQGRLNDGGSPANGVYDLRFAIYNSTNIPGTVIAGPVTNAAAAVSNGFFTVALDFGPGVFTGPDRWLDISVRSNGVAAFTPLTPRQKITAAPYAITAGHLTGTVASSQLTGAISSNNIGAGSITSVMLAAGAVGSNQLAVGAVTTAALANGAVTAAKVGTVSNLFPVTIANPTPAAGDNFSYTLAALGTDRLLIGAPYDDTRASDAGAAYLFDINGTLLITFANPTPAADEKFGYAIAAVGTDRLLVGAYADNLVGSGAGAAYLFSTNSSALLTTFTNPTPTITQFGAAVAAVGTERLLIGAGGGTGAAYLFNTNGRLQRTFTNPAPATITHFGTAVAAVGTDRVLIGAEWDNTGAFHAGAAYLFRTNGALLTTFTNPTPAASEYFGQAVAVVGTDRVLIGAYFDSAGAPAAGAAYLFNTNGTLLITFTNPAPATLNYFGAAVAAVGTDRVLIGAAGVDTGAFDAGVAYLFDTNGVVLATFTNPTPGDSDDFGSAVAAVGTDRVLIGAVRDHIGAVGAGAAYLFTSERFTPGLVADSVNARSITTISMEDGAVTLAKLDSSIGVWARNGDNVYRLPGRVGIGTATPGNPLTVEGIGTADGGSGLLNQVMARFECTGAANSAISIDAATGFDSVLYFAENGLARWGLRHDASQEHELVFQFSPTGVPPLRLRTNGNLIVSATITGDRFNSTDSTATGSHATALGNGANAAGEGAVAMGIDVSASGQCSLAVGTNNLASGNFSIALGRDNQAAQAFSFAAGRRARANHTGAFVWADSQNTDFASSTPNQFSVRASGGVRFNSDTSLFFENATRQMLNLYNQIYGIGVQSDTLYFRTDTGYAWFRDGVHTNVQNDPGPGGLLLMRLDGSGNLFTTGAVNPPSDRHAKKDFAPVDVQVVLRKVAAMPLHTWTYTNEPSGICHLGPVAQDFHAAFGLGADDKHIATVDADGVALAAIQGLNQKVDDRSQESGARIQKLEAENAELKTRLTILENLVNHLSSKGN